MDATPLRRTRAGFPAWLTNERAFVIACAFIILALQIELVFTKSVNWDEFFGFGQIHQFRRGEPVPLLQVPYVYLFSWVPTVPGSAIDHIVAIRLLILPFELLTIAIIYDLARRFVSRDAAILTAMAYLGGGHVFLHAFALRADMIAAALLMVALWVMLTRRFSLLEVAAAALLLGLACMATIKSVLYAPIFIAALWWRRDILPTRLLVPASLATGLVAIAALTATGILGAIIELTRQSAARMFSEGLFPQLGYFADQLLTAPFFTLMIVAGTILAFNRKNGTQCVMVLLACLIPLAAVAIYRNAFPYYFGFALAPAALVAAPGADWLRKRYGLAPMAAILAINALALSLSEDRQVIRDQRIVHAGIAEIFSEPVTYIDDADFIGAFPRAVPHFASGWGLAGYRANGKPSYRNALEQGIVPLLFREGPAMENSDPAKDNELTLLPVDTAILSENFIPHWGRLFVAGKRIPAGVTGLEVDILVPGIYTIERSPLVIDGQSYGLGSTIDLHRGSHVLSSGADAATLRWGDHLPRPAFAWPDGPLYTNY